MSERRSIERIAPLLGQDLRLDYTLGGGFFEDADLASGKRPERSTTAVDLAWTTWSRRSPTG
jgi:hypothetical protein